MNQNEQLQPFFARFLESQKSEHHSTEQQFDPWPVPVPIPTKPILDLEHTLKYPSDSDEI